MQQRAPLQEYHELIERIGETMKDHGIDSIIVGEVKISIIDNSFKDMK